MTSSASSAASRSTSLLRSPRANLQALLSAQGLTAPDHFDLAYGTLLPADAENKLHHRKLYLVLDLDETLVYAHRMGPDETAVGTVVQVRGTPYDVVPRPGLKFFLNMAYKNFVIYLYTMGDADYAHAVLKVIDPEGKYFRGGACCWRPSESRQHKSLARVVCDRRMALIVDDSVDVWGGDLANLCLTRRFVGDKLDDGLQLLAQQLSQVHSSFFKGAPAEGYSLEAPEGSPRCAPSVFSVLASSRGRVLSGCRIALTGIVADLSEAALEVEGVPLAGLIQLYGGELCLSVDQATHLVARRKEGWKASPKIKKALVRLQVGAARPPRRNRPAPLCSCARSHARPVECPTSCRARHRARCPLSLSLRARATRDDDGAALSSPCRRLAVLLLLMGPPKRGNGNNGRHRPPL